MKVAIITAIYDDYDELKPIVPQDGVEVDWVFVTDNEKVRDDDFDSRGWRTEYRPRNRGIHPCRAAKHPKMVPWLYTLASHSIWIDGSFRITSPRFAVEALAHAEASPDGFAQFKHPWRDCLFDEADATLNLKRYEGEWLNVGHQTKAYRTQEMPLHWGLWATGVIARHDHAQQKQRLWNAFWLRQCADYSYQDQISHPFACWKHGVRPGELPGTHFVNDWVTYEGSGRHVHG